MEDNTNKVIVTRRLIQKLLASEACKYLYAHKLRELNDIFIEASQERFVEMTKSIVLPFRRPTIDRNQSDYYSGVCDLTITWVPAEADLQDGEGNLWRAEKLSVRGTAHSGYGLEVSDIKLRSQIYTAVGELVADIASSFSEPIGVRTHTNEERIEKEKKEIYDDGMAKVATAVFGKKLYRNMRRGSVRRISKVFLEGVEKNTYTVTHNFGSRRNQNIKTFAVRVSEDGSGVMTRIA